MSFTRELSERKCAGINYRCSCYMLHVGFHWECVDENPPEYVVCKWLLINIAYSGSQLFSGMHFAAANGNFTDAYSCHVLSVQRRSDGFVLLICQCNVPETLRNITWNLRNTLFVTCGLYEPPTFCAQISEPQCKNNQ